MESEAFAYLNIFPEQLYDLTMREYSNLLGGAEIRRETKRKENADLVMMQVRAKSKKGRVSIDDILGKETKKTGTADAQRKVTPDEKRSELSFLEDELGGSEYISS